MRLSNKQIEHFIELGYVKIEDAFSQEIAKTCRSILWKQMNLDPNEPKTWNEPVVRITELGDEPFRKAANTPTLLNAYQQLAGDNWVPRTAMGSFPIRFPSKKKPVDLGWHVDASFPGEDPSDYMNWKVNIRSKGRALLMLFLFSDVSENDAPTRILEGSHMDVAKILHPYGDDGLSFMQLANRLEVLPGRNEAIATGSAGTVFLCHPFLVHAAQEHKGKEPRMMAQPPLMSKDDFDISRRVEVSSPVEQAIMSAL